MTKRLRGKIGEAVMIVIMGAMVVGGIVMWLSTGHFHMMPGHGGKHTKEEAVSSAPHDAQKEHSGSHSEGHRKADGNQNSEDK